MSHLNKLMSDMDDNDKQELFELVDLFNDPLSRDILGKLASQHSPIFADQVTYDFNAEPIDVLCILGEQKKMGLVKTEFISRNERKICKYTITEIGKEYAKQYARLEIEKHSEIPTLK